MIILIKTDNSIMMIVMIRIMVCTLPIMMIVMIRIMVSTLPDLDILMHFYKADLHY